MIKKNELALYLHDFLDCGNYTDYAPNGMQIEGTNEIRRICTAVTASYEAITQAISWQADALLVHHGYFWRGEEQVITGIKRQRIAALLVNDINLLAYHLPLDCHVSLGNNACLAKYLGIDSPEMHKAGNTTNLLWSGQLPQSMNASLLTQQLETLFKRTPLHIAGHDRPISRIAWCSGGAQDFIVEASQLGVDAFLSGEVSERTYYQAKELGIDYYSCGHHATERYGIEALGRHLSDKFKLEHVFFDSNNPV